tara:strand:+ start:1328 stop:1498 length:171 start_codon:yes stop_codon:yes gene_type:complete
MCIICVEWQAEKLTLEEAWHNLRELTDEIGTKHTWEVIDLLKEVTDKEQKDEREDD